MASRSFCGRPLPPDPPQPPPPPPPPPRSPAPPSRGCPTSTSRPSSYCWRRASTGRATPGPDRPRTLDSDAHNFATFARSGGLILRTTKDAKRLGFPLGTRCRCWDTTSLIGRLLRSRVLGALAHLLQQHGNRLANCSLRIRRLHVCLQCFELVLRVVAAHFLIC